MSVSLEDYCLRTTFAPSGRTGWLWVESEPPWGGLYEPAGNRVWFHQCPAPDMGTRLVYPNGSSQWVLGTTHLVTTRVESITDTVPLQPMLWPKKSRLDVGVPNCYESADKLQRVWEFSFFKRYRTVLSGACQRYCNGRADCLTHLQTACDTSGSDTIDTSGSDVCECFREQTFYDALHKKLSEDNNLSPTSALIDNRPPCLWGHCNRSTLRYDMGGRQCPDLAVCNATAKLTVEQGSVILAGQVNVAATCIFKQDGTRYEIEDEKVTPLFDGFVGARGGNALAFWKDHYGFDLQNPVVLAVCGMLILAVVVAMQHI